MLNAVSLATNHRVLYEYHGDIAAKVADYIKTKITQDDMGGFQAPAQMTQPPQQFCDSYHLQSAQGL